jgi:ribosomal protein S18 acetylase RimI-like enzyme
MHAETTFGDPTRTSPGLFLCRVREQADSGNEETIMRILGALSEISRFAVLLGRGGQAAPRARHDRRPIRVRRARISDVRSLMEMWQESVRELASVDAVAAAVDLSCTAERERFFELLIFAADAGVTVAETAAGKLVGMLTFQEFSNPGFFKIQRLALVSAVHVSPACRRSGIAAQMVEQTLEWLQSRGIEEVQLANSPWNTPADRTWERLGFEVITVTRRKLLKR